MAVDARIRTNYRLEIEVLSPLHIGAGKGNLLYDYDYVGHRGNIWVIDQEKLLEHVSEEELLKPGSVETNISRVLHESQYSDCARYPLPYGAEAPKEIVPFVKDVHLRPYLPGSSLKGAIRTAIAWAGYGQRGARLDGSELLEEQRRANYRLNPKRADDPFERRLLGRDPNHDLLRALHVGDSTNPERGGLELATVALYTLRDALQPKGPGYRWHLEVLPRGSRLVSALGLDQYLLVAKARELGFEVGKRFVEEDLAAHCKSQALSIITGDIGFYRQHGQPKLRQFYEDLGETTRGLAEGEFVLQIAWGAGWRGKTLSSRLEEDGSIDQVRQVYRLGRENAPFPKTRRLVERGNVAEAPLGWLKARIVGGDRP